MDGSKEKSAYTIDSLLKGLEVLALFDQKTPTYSLSEIVAVTGFGKSNTFRILSTLETAAYLERDPETKRYRPGFRAVHLGMSAISGLNLREIAYPHLRQLVNQASEAVGMAILDELQIVYLERLFPKNAPAIMPGVGARRPAAITAVGKVLVAHLPEEERKNWIANYLLDSNRHQDGFSRTELVLELDRIQEQGYGYCPYDDEYIMGAKAVAAPIFDDKKQIVAAVNIAGSEKRISDMHLQENLLPLVSQTADHISRMLGYNG